MNEAREDIQQAVAFEHVFPKVGRAIASACRIGRIARGAIVAFVEREEVRRRAGETGRHEHGLGIDGEVNQRTPLELEDRLARVSVTLVLPSCVLGPLAGERVFQFEGDYRNAVQAQRDIE